ncbi:DUF1993 domain-containing protein [Quisquiliibacterium transsilvanicum]|uniref:DUF1993 domain-containing protein n=1 Tax=Quisquiliibacterium transsilvanicum TaxID=1549638 RepID=A0A7W8MAC0_9BURK|nr:DUF1993 domain-containing protein [Quisquiliibacterium transsilvanicum]MBB5272984.1 hypothetical protein [Quisquiliibacterium transsilvanicum]
MTISLYDASVPVYTQMLGALDKVLGKAEAWAEARKIDGKVLAQARLFPDMLPLVSQVRIACDAARAGTARLAGIDFPKYEDNEQTLAELRQRIAGTLAFIEQVPRESIAGQEQRDITIPLRERKLEMKGQAFLLHWSLPNFFFHVTTAYDILRHNGLEVGKADFLGHA